MRLSAATAVVVSGLALAVLAGCSNTTPGDASPSAQGPAPGTASSSPTPLVGQAPDGTPIPGGKPTWLDSLPNPASVDRNDPEAVMSAYITTVYTWDSRVDRTSAYAAQRAAIYQTEEHREALEEWDPDSVTGQDDFIEAAKHDAYTTVTIRDIIKEGLDPDSDGDVHRIVHYLVTTTRRDGTGTHTESWDAWVTVTQQDDQWVVETVNTRPSQT